MGVRINNQEILFNGVSCMIIKSNLSNKEKRKHCCKHKLCFECDYCNLTPTIFIQAKKK